MSFVLKIEAPGASTAAAEIAKVETQLGKASDEVAVLRAEFDKASDRAAKFGQNTQSIGQKLADQFRTAQRALNDLLAQALEPAARSFGKLTEAIAREQAVIERIRGPMREYYADIVALDMAHKRGVLTTAEFTAEMERLTAARRSAATAKAAETIGLPTVPGQAPGVGGGVAAVYAGLAGAGIAEVASRIQGLIRSIQDMHDVWIEASNAAVKFVDATHDLNRVVAEQITLAHDLHSNYKTTIGLYDTVRDGTDELNFSHRDQVRILETLGKASAVAGRSLESVGGLVEQLSYAAARGSIEMREMDSIMRQVPDVATLWTEKFGVSRRELKSLVDQGKITVTDLIAAFVTNTKTVDENHKRIARTGAEIRNEFLNTVDLFQSKQGAWDSWLGGFGDAWESLHPEDRQRTWADLAVSFQESAESIAKAAERAGDAIFRKLVKNLREAPEYLSASIDLLKGYGDQLGRVAGILSDPWGDDKTGFGAQVKLLRSIREPIEEARKQLQNLRAEHVKGQITADEYQKQYEALVTTINDGRLPATIKLWHELNDPIRASDEAIAALNATLAVGGISIGQYNARMTALQDTLVKLRSEATEQARVTHGVPVGPRNMGGTGVYITAAAADAPERTRAATPDAIGEQIAALQTGKRTNELRLYNEQKAREFDLAGQTVTADLEYAQAIETINGALALHAITQERANRLTDQARDSFESAKDSLAGYASIVEQFTGPQKRYEDGVRAADAALRDGRINAEQHAIAIDQIRVAFLAADPAGKTFTGTLEQMFLKAKLEAQSFGQQLGSTLFSDLDKINSALVDMTADGEVSWREFGSTIKGVVGGIIQDLERMLLKQLEIMAITAILNAIVPGSGTVAGASGATGSIVNALPAFATGGRWVVGGSGGTDSQVQAFRATPGERVTVETPGEYRHQSGAAGGTVGAGGSSAVNMKVVNQIDDSMILGAIDGPGGDRVLVNSIRRNAGAIRSYLGIGK